MDSDLDDRRPGLSGAGSDDEQKRNRKKVATIVVAALLAVAIAGKASWFALAIDLGSHHHSRGPVVIDAAQIYDAYRDDEHAADERFRGREMVVSGEFVRIVPDGQGNPDLRFKTENPEAPLGADLVPVSYNESARLRPGQRVTVSCQRITGSSDDRWLQNCAIQSVGEGSASSSASPSPSPSPSASPSPSPSPGEGNSG
jgi:hypothetical protein